MNDDHKKIRIHTVEGGDLQDQQALKRNYFESTGVNDTYQFFTPDGSVIPTVPIVLASGHDFTFSLREMPGTTWTIINFEISGDQGAGNWTNDRRTKAEEDGSFQAQAGPTFEETASSATV